MSNLILLTGAGFTKNFGGFLGNEMWAKIFNNPKVQNSPRLKEYLFNDFNYENVYYEFIEYRPATYSSSDKTTLIESIVEAYALLDESIIQSDWQRRIDRNEFFGNFIQNFDYHFTLNQDLFFERHFKVKCPASPQLSIHIADHFTPFREEDFVKLETVTLDMVNEAIDSHAGMPYVKLHGSYGWLSENGQKKLVIGRNKLEDIANESLLQHYFNLFKEVIKKGEAKILIVGYGFADEHINRVLVNGIDNYDTSIFIINPNNPEDFSNYIHDQNMGAKIWRNTSGYFPYNLQDIFPKAISTTVPRKEIEIALSI